MNKYIIFFFLLLGLGACKAPDQDVVPAKSAAAKIVRFRIYQNVNTFYDATIGDSTIVITIPIEVDRSTLRPEVLVSSGAIVSPKSGEIENFTGIFNYTVVSESGKITKVYAVEVKN